MVQLYWLYSYINLPTSTAERWSQPRSTNHPGLGPSSICNETVSKHCRPIVLQGALYLCIIYIFICTNSIIGLESQIDLEQLNLPNKFYSLLFCIKLMSDFLVSLICRISSLKIYTRRCPCVYCQINYSYEITILNFSLEETVWYHGEKAYSAPNV